MNQEEYELIVKKEQAKAQAIVFCQYHEFPESILEETENGFRFCIEFNYK